MKTHDIPERSEIRYLHRLDNRTGWFNIYGEDKYFSRRFGYAYHSRLEADLNANVETALYRIKVTLK